MQKVIVLLRQRSGGVAGLMRAGPLAQTLRAHGAKGVTTGSKLPFVVASVSKAQESALAASPAVRAVLPDAVIPTPSTPLSPDSNPFTPFTPHSVDAGDCLRPVRNRLCTGERPGGERRRQGNPGERARLHR